MADLAIVFHWPLSDLEELEIEELAYWWQKARARSRSKDDE